MTLNDQACELAHYAISERGLHVQLSCASWDALANKFGEQIKAFALDLVDQELARRDEEKRRLEAA